MDNSSNVGKEHSGGERELSPHSAPECCVDWKPQTEKLNAPIVLAQARNPHLTATLAFQFKPWRFCPWCGRNREEFERTMKMKESELLSKGIGQ